VTVAMTVTPSLSTKGKRRMTTSGKYFGSLRLREEDGQAMVEYALILALVTLVSVGALTLIGTRVDAIFTALLAGFPA
jgi:Flp pilus assembly pilin Flp